MDFATVSPKNEGQNFGMLPGCYLDVHPSGWKMVGFWTIFEAIKAIQDQHPSPSLVSRCVFSRGPQFPSACAHRQMIVVSGCRESSTNTADELVQVLVL